MTDMFAVRTDAALIDSIIERGFDPSMPVGGDEFLRLIADAEAIDAAGREALPAAIAQMGDHFGETGDALTVPVAVGHRWLVRLLDTTPVTLEETAIADALLTLVRRLVPVIQQTVQFEALVSRSAQGIGGGRDEIHEAVQPLLDAWMDRWRMFPVLAALVTLTLTNWIRAIEEMIRALEQDHADLTVLLKASASPRTIQSIQGDAGDPHLGGRSVMILTFADGARVVFKPKHLAITDVFRRLVDRINAAGYATPLRVHEAIVSERHTWEQYVPHRACETEAQVERFYRRMGGWIRLLQMLEGRDFWLDNLIADGEFPIFIDLETIMQPRRRDAELSGAAALAQDRIESSPLVTNIVAMPMPIGPGIDAEELGCFATPKAFLSPFPATEIAGVRSDGTSRNGYRTWTHPDHAPTLNGDPVVADMWFAAIEAGYREMAETIDRLAPELLEPGGLVDQLSRHPVRTIFRDTWTCVRVIHRSTAPPLLGSHQRRRTFLERMDRDASEDAMRTGAVIAAEVRAMISLDVPFFSAYGVDDAIHPPDGAPVTAFFDGTARDRVVANLRAVSPQRLEDDVSLLRTSFWTAHPKTPVVETTGRPAAASLEASAWQAAACRIADDIAATRLIADDRTSSWIALTYHTTADIEAWSPIGSDLLSGRAGLAVHFCDMWRASGDDRWRALAAESAREVAESLWQVLQAWREDTSSRASGQSPPLLVGAFTGVGGMLAAVKLVAEALDDVTLDRSWRALVESFDWESILAQASSDVVGGTVGLGLALTARQGWIDQLPGGLREALTSVAQREDAVDDLALSPGARGKLAGLPGARVARLLLRSRLGVGNGVDVQRAIAEILESGPTTGDLLGAIALSQPGAPWWGRLCEVVAEAYDERRLARGRLPQLDAAELALAMLRSSGDAAWHDRARSLGERWIAEFNASGSWFPADLADDRYRLSSVRGVPAIASSLLRIGGAPAVASFRTLDWQVWGSP